jgi:hypothetical protein
VFYKLLHLKKDAQWIECRRPEEKPIHRLLMPVPKIGLNVQTLNKRNQARTMIVIFCPFNMAGKTADGRR